MHLEELLQCTPVRLLIYQVGVANFSRFWLALHHALIQWFKGIVGIHRTHSFVACGSCTYAHLPRRGCVQGMKKHPAYAECVPHSAGWTPLNLPCILGRGAKAPAMPRKRSVIGVMRICKEEEVSAGTDAARFRPCQSAADTWVHILETAVQGLIKQAPAGPTKGR